MGEKLLIDTQRTGSNAPDRTFVVSNESGQCVRAAGLSPTESLEIYARIGRSNLAGVHNLDPQLINRQHIDYKWVPLVRGGKAVKLTASNMEHLEFIAGTYCVGDPAVMPTLSGDVNVVSQPVSYEAANAYTALNAAGIITSAPPADPVADFEVVTLQDPVSNTPKIVVQTINPLTGVPSAKVYNVDGSPSTVAASSLITPKDSSTYDTEGRLMNDGVKEFYRWFVSKDGVAVSSYDTDKAGAPYVAGATVNDGPLLSSAKAFVDTISSAWSLATFITSVSAKNVLAISVQVLDGTCAVSAASGNPVTLRMGESMDWSTDSSLSKNLNDSGIVLTPSGQAHLSVTYN